MISNEELQRIFAELVIEVADDLVGLWLLQEWVRRAGGSDLDPATVRAITLALVDQAIESGKVVAGSFDGDDFQTWTTEPSAAGEVRRRIERVWSDSRRELAPTDNVWLSGRDLNYRTVK